MAIVLTELKNDPGEDYIHVTWSPTPLTAEDVEWFLRPDDDPAVLVYKKNLDNAARQANLSGEPMAIYELKFTYEQGAEVLTLTVESQARCDPPYSRLIVTRDSQTYAISSWRIE